MRIAWVLYGSLEQRTGGTIYDAQVVAGLRRAGDDVQVLSLDPGEPALPRGAALTLPPLARAAATAKAGLALARRVEELAPDVVVGDELCFPELAVAFRMLARGKRTPRRVLLVHHLTAWEAELAPLRRRVVRAGERLAVEASDALIATSHATRARLVAEGVRERIDVALPGADRLERRPRESLRAGGEVVFLFLGTVAARKGVLPMVRAFARGASAHAMLRLVGSTTREPAYVDEVERSIDELGLRDRVTLDGEVDEDGVSRALAAADVLVMPSSLEGYGIAATEAVVAGLPVIAARAQGIEEALAPCPEARLFADDEDALAVAMQRFATEASLRAAMVDAARAAASRMPSWAGCAEAFRAALLA